MTERLLSGRERSEAEMVNSMKAGVYYGIEDIRYEEVPKPQISDDEYLLKVRAVAICGSDLRTFLHGHSKVVTPQILGHEFAGDVVEVGKNVKGVSVGDRLSVHPGIPCGHCYYCQRGLQNHCVDRPGIGTVLPGAFAEYVKIPSKTIEAGTVFHIPEGKKYELAALGDPAVSALHGEEELDVRLGDTLCILGSGSIGILHAMIARLKGASTIILVNRSPERLEKARQMGVADHYFCLKTDGDLREFVMNVTDGMGANKVCVANTAKASAVQALEIAAKGGTVEYFAGFPKDDPALGIDGNLIHYRELKVIGSFGSTPRQFQEAEKLLVEERIPAEKIITHRLPLSKINEGFGLMKRGECFKVILDPTLD